MAGNCDRNSETSSNQNNCLADFKIETLRLLLSSGIEFDAIEIGSGNKPEPELEQSRELPVDWLEEALAIRNRLEKQEQPANENIANGQENSPTRYPEPNNLENESPIPDDAAKQSILKKGAETYELEKYKKNAMIIFNHEKFLACEKVRNYTMKDEEALETTFKKFGFIVDKHLDLRKAELIQTLEEFSSKDFSLYGCICAVIMTHGAKNGWLRAHDTRYSEHEFIECFNVERNNTLLGKPVIIIIQACRGDEPANAVNHCTSQSEEHVELDFDEPYSLPTEADRLIFHSSYFGRASVRATEGSWFIQALCHQIKTFAHVHDFETICRAVRRNVAIEKQHNMRLRRREIVAKQMPVVTTCLTRLLFLKRNEGTDENDGICRDKQCVEDKKSDSDVGPDKTEYVSACNEYFEYLKRTLRLFINENPDDDVAQSILNVAENDRNIHKKKSAKIAMTNLIRNYLNRNMDRFTRSELVYLGRPCCCATQTRAQTRYWCDIL